MTEIGMLIRNIYRKIYAYNDLFVIYFYSSYRRDFYIT